jgi:hypothetical protein
MAANTIGGTSTLDQLLARFPNGARPGSPVLNAQRSVRSPFGGSRPCMVDPVAGIAGLEAVTTPVTALLAVDMPWAWVRGALDL